MLDLLFILFDEALRQFTYYSDSLLDAVLSQEGPLFWLTEALLILVLAFIFLPLAICLHVWRTLLLILGVLPTRQFWVRMWVLFWDKLAFDDDSPMMTLLDLDTDPGYYVGQAASMFCLLFFVVPIWTAGMLVFRLWQYLSHMVGA